MAKCSFYSIQDVEKKNMDVNESLRVTIYSQPETSSVIYNAVMCLRGFLVAIINHLG